jgi:hypothetical protein
MGMRLLLKSKWKVESIVAVSRARELSVSGCHVGACATMSSSEDIPACLGSGPDGLLLHFVTAPLYIRGPKPCSAYWTRPI